MCVGVCVCEREMFQFEYVEWIKSSLKGPLTRLRQYNFTYEYKKKKKKLPGLSFIGMFELLYRFLSSGLQRDPPILTLPLL